MGEDVLKTLLQSISSKSQRVNLQSYLDSLSRDAIVKSIPDLLHSSAASELIGTVLDGISNSKVNRNSFLLKVIESIVTELCDSEAVPERTAMEVVHVISSKIHELDSNDLAKLVQHCLSFIQSGKNLQGKWLSLFPMLYSELSKQGRVTIDGDAMTGVQYCDEIIGSLCNTVVSSEDAVAFASVLRELKVPSNFVGRIVEKLCALIPEMEPQELPPLVYQLLFLCDVSHHLAPLQHLAKYFQAKLRTSDVKPKTGSTQPDSMDIESDVIESSSSKEMLQAKATSIYHISRAASTGHPLSKEFVKFLRGRVNIPELILVPFILEVALSLGGLPQLRDVIDMLRKVVQNCLTCNEKLRSSAWMREIMENRVIDVPELLDTVMQQCTCEWDHIFKGLELLAFSLLEMRPPGFPGRTAASNVVVANATQTGQTGVLQQCWHIGSQILQKMIKKFPDSAQSIVQKLVERLQDSGNDMQYINTISELVQHNSLIMLDCKASLTSMLYSMDYRGVASAKCLYSAISPLFRASASLRESAFLVLRKLLHSCSEDARQVAIVGFLQILKNFRYYAAVTGMSLSQTSMSSQATVDVHQSSSAAANRAFCNELIKLLQCALSQQCAVRLTLYQSLPEIVSRNPELVPECVKMLRNHLKFFIDPEAVIQVQQCVLKDGSCSAVIEPLGQLIQSILQVIARSGLTSYFSKDIDGSSEDQVDQGLLMMRKIVKQVASASVDDFALGDTSDAAATDSQLKLQTANSVCVALMDFCVSSGATSLGEWSQYLVQIYELHAKFESLLKDSKVKGKGKTAAAAAKKDKDASHEEPATAAAAAKKFVFEMCAFSFQNTAQLLAFLCSDPPPSGVLASNKHLHLWVLESALRNCRWLRVHGQVEGLSTESIVKYCGTLGRALLHSSRKYDGDPAVYTCSLECLNEMLNAVCKHQHSKLPRLLASLNGDARTSTLELQVSKILQELQRILEHLLSEGESDLAKGSLAVIGSLAVLSDQLSPDCQVFKDLLEWIKRLCKNSDCSDTTTVKALIGFLVQLNRTSLSAPTVILQLAQQVRGAIGDLDTTMPVEPERFACVNDDTAAVVLAVVAAGVDQLLQVVEWANPRIADKSEANTIAIEKSVYSRVSLLVNTLSELVQTSFSPGPNSELVLKMATTFYTSTGHLIKRQGKAILPQLERLVRAIAVQLTVKVYTFISHIESNEENGRKRKRGGNDKDGIKVLKRTRAVPALIFALEQYSQAVLALSTRTKVDLSFGFKPGTSRDFRIKDDLVNEALEIRKDDDSARGDSVAEPTAAASASAAAASAAAADADAMDIDGEGSKSDESRNVIRGPIASRRGRGRGRGRGKFQAFGKLNASNS